MKIKSGIEQPHQAMELQGYRSLRTDKFGRKMIKVTVIQNILTCKSQLMQCHRNIISSNILEKKIKTLPKIFESSKYNIQSRKQ